MCKEEVMPQATDILELNKMCEDTIMSVHRTLCKPVTKYTLTASIATEKVPVNQMH